MSAEQLGEMIRGQKAAIYPRRLLGAHQRTFNHTSREHNERQHDIHDPNAFVVGAGQPIAPQRAPPPEPSQDHHHG